MARDEDPLERRGRHAVEDPTDRAAPTRVPAVHLRPGLGHVEEVDPERLDDALARAVVAVGHAHRAGGAVHPPELRRPPAVGRLLEAVLVIPWRLPGPRTSVRGGAGGLEHRVGAVVERLAGGPHGRHRGGPVRHVPARVEGEGDLVHDAPHDRQREPRPGLPVAPVVPDDPASDARFSADAAIGHGR